MQVELFTNGEWQDTKLMVDGKLEKFVTKIDMFIGDKKKARIVAGSLSLGSIPYGSLVDIKGIRYKIDESGQPMKTSDRTGLQIESFEYKHVNVYKVD